MCKERFGAHLVQCLDLTIETYRFAELEGFLRAQPRDKLLLDSSGNDSLPQAFKSGDDRLRRMIQSMRVVKSPAEIALMREAADIGAEAMKGAMRMSQTERSEHRLASYIEYQARLLGADGLSYVPVVAGGARACIIHYTRNDMQIGSGDMLLLDAGAMHKSYCSDITRTWPVSGEFTEAQLDIYRSVLNVQLFVLKTLQEHAARLSMRDLNYLAVRATEHELSRLGFEDPEAACRRLYPHSIGHFLGMDLHDCPLLSDDLLLKPGMVLTVEPGLYIPADEACPGRYHGIGVRIEDDVLITDGGIEVLTASVPKDPAELIDHLASG